jgi:hypothetical protein
MKLLICLSENMQDPNPGLVPDLDPTLTTKPDHSDAPHAQASSHRPISHSFPAMLSLEIKLSLCKISDFFLLEHLIHKNYPRIISLRFSSWQLEAVT